ncbi:hypothetical protein [Acinetobacter puyangensis]|uniref:hypothetical protein n=1 Tax=Acinetobacter puyangensis TaxID=1096779 RepID=UPI003A4D4E3E
MTKNQLAIVKKDNQISKFRPKRWLAGAGALFGTAASQAAITATDVTGIYDSSGATETIDGVGIVIIGIVIGLTVVGIILSLVKKK